MDGTHRQILKRNFHHLVEQITVTVGFLAEFVSMGIFTPEMVNTIKVENTNSEKVFKLINLLLRRGPDAFNMFIYILNEDHKWLASKLVKTGEILNADLYMSSQQNYQLTRYRHLIEENVRLDDIWNDVEHIFSPPEKMDIQTQPNSREEMKKMLDILLHQSDVAFRHLVDALRQVDRRLAGLLEHGASVIPTTYNADYINHDNQHRRNAPLAFDQNGRNEDFFQGYQSILRQSALNNQNLFLQRQINWNIRTQHRNSARYTLGNTCLAFSWQYP